MTLEPLGGLRVVDLFSGSGALGIEALSRGAARADFVDFQGLANRALKANLTALALESRATSWNLELPRGLKQIASPLGQADLVFLDPPYSGPLGRLTLEALGGSGTLKSGAMVLVEHHTKDAMPETVGGLTRVRQRRYGETMVSTYRNQRHE
jgi:16S rRNA (guanine(966)-N(2))-methyltransferase RsmD